MKKTYMLIVLTCAALIALCQQGNGQAQNQNASTTTNRTETRNVTTTTNPSAAPSGDNKRTADDSQWEAYKPGRTLEYKSTALNTNFTVPLIRFNRTSGDASKQGSVSFFNSIGAGLGINWGTIEVTTDNTGKVINTELNNTIGIQLGALFAANTNNGASENIFAPTLSVSILNFQVGYGIELGTVAANQKKGFVTIAYNIPIAKLIKGGFYLLARSPKATNDDTAVATPLTPAAQPSAAPNRSRFSIN